MVREVNFDKAATTAASDEVIEAMMPWIGVASNPSSIHALGIKAKQAIEKARDKIALYLGVEPDTLFFTSGATESNVWAIDGYKPSKYSYTLTSEIEHASILKNTWHLWSDKIPATSEGKIDYENFKHLKEAAFCSFIHVNNVTGVKNDIKAISETLADLAILHVDATQSFGKMNIDINGWGIDMLSASSHKISGPQGVGLLYMSKRVQRLMQPLICGTQQGGFRGGTENVAGIIGFSKAVELAYENMEVNQIRLHKLHDYFRDRLVASDFDYEFIVDPDKQCPTHMNVAFNGIKADQLLRRLSEHGIYASAGSACSNNESKLDHVLVAMGVDKDLIESAIRFSFSAENELDEVDYLMDVLKTELPLMR